MAGSQNCKECTAATETPAAVCRPIHYLGSKLRLIDAIREAVDEVAPAGQTVCDLFAGSGTVSQALSGTRNVIAVDIQEYSRVLCSALLAPAPADVVNATEFLVGATASEHAQHLAWAIEPLVNHETKVQAAAASGDVAPLCNLLERGSLVVYERNGQNIDDKALLLAMREANTRLRKFGLDETAGTLATRYFGGVYFSYRQAADLDVLGEQIAALPSNQRDIFLAALLSTASETVNTVGNQFAQPIRPRSSDGRPKPSLSRKVCRDRAVCVMNVYERWLRRYFATPRTNGTHEVVRANYHEALQQLDRRVDVVYADPPYTRDHYSRYYHVLETLCLRDNPDLSTVRIGGKNQISRGIYRLDRYQSPFCIKSQAPKAFATLFSDVRRMGVPLVLSYSPYDCEAGARPRLMTIEQILSLAQEHFDYVTVRPAASIAHSKFNNATKNKAMSYEAEVLMVCIP